MDEEMAQLLGWGRQRLEEMGVFRTPQGLRWAAAHGIMLLVWRNGPIEDAHASGPTSRRKALHDGTMFARNTWLIRQTFDILESEDRFRLYELEDLLLDRDTVWPGCDGSLADFGWGFLGDIKKHVKRGIDVLSHYQRRMSPADFLVFAGSPQIGTHDDHYGMPRWLLCVEVVMRRLRGDDEAFWLKQGALMERIGPPPATVTADLGRTQRLMLECPWELGTVLTIFGFSTLSMKPGSDASGRRTAGRASSADHIRRLGRYGVHLPRRQDRPRRGCPTGTCRGQHGDTRL
ncbi:hypothetical protein [Streptomyces chartreusis]